MTDPQPILLDVRPTLGAGEDPFDEIMAAVDRLEPGQALVLVNSFEPFPLYDVMAGRGFERSVERFPNGDWRITFRRSPGAPTGGAAGPGAEVGRPER